MRCALVITVRVYVGLRARVRLSCQHFLKDYRFYEVGVERERERELCVRENRESEGYTSAWE